MHVTSQYKGNPAMSPFSPLAPALLGFCEFWKEKGGRGGPLRQVFHIVIVHSIPLVLNSVLNEETGVCVCVCVCVCVYTHRNLDCFKFGAI